MKALKTVHGSIGLLVLSLCIPLSVIRVQSQSAPGPVITPLYNGAPGTSSVTVSQKATPLFKIGGQFHDDAGLSSVSISCAAGSGTVNPHGAKDAFVAVSFYDSYYAAPKDYAVKYIATNRNGVQSAWTGEIHLTK